MKKPAHRILDASAGFSLVELLVGVAILGLLVGVSGAAYQKAMGKASLAAEVSAGKSLTQAYLLAASENGGRYLPAYDGTARNQPIQNPDAFQVNTASMRCMTKALALHGLGSYIYAGDDLPEDDSKAASTPTASMGELTKKEDAPKYEKIVAKTAPKADPTLDNSDASRQLFADGMVEYTTHCTTVAGLNSYWKSNQLQLDSLKVTHPDLYQQVLTKFQELKKQLSEGETK